MSTLLAATGAWTNADVANFLGAIQEFALIAMLGALVLGAGLWGLANATGHSGIMNRASHVVIAAVVGAAVIGAAGHLVAWAFHFTGG
jgi:hypothetical protein